MDQLIRGQCGIELGGALLPAPVLEIACRVSVWFQNGTLRLQGRRRTNRRSDDRWAVRPSESLRTGIYAHASGILELTDGAIYG